MRKPAYFVGGLMLVAAMMAAWALRPREAKGVEAGMVILDGPPVGAKCEVFLRRDYIATHINGETTGIELQTGAENFMWRKSVRGSLVRINEQWIVIQREENRQDWIPRKAVVAIEVTAG